MNLLTEEQLEVIKKNLDIFGQDKCLRQCQEECTELATAISHFLRPEKCNIDELIEEAADMIICLAQMEMVILKIDVRKGMLDNYIRYGMNKTKEKTELKERLDANSKTE